MRFLLFVLLAASSLEAQQRQVRLDTDLTKVTFSLGDVLHTVHGTFRLTKGDLWFDPASAKAGGKLVVNGASGDSGSHARDSRMSKSILESDIYPEIAFTPDHLDGAVNLSGHSESKLHGVFAIHGATRDLTMNIKTDIQQNRVTATADFIVPYVEWGMKNPSTLFLRVNDTVSIEIHAVGEINTPGVK
jgi:polyisoprenoid-binding protein YceI